MLWEDPARCDQEGKVRHGGPQYATPPTPQVVNVSRPPQDLYSMLLSDLGKKINDAQLSTQNTLIDLSERMDRIEKGKTVNTAYSTKDLTPSSAAPTSTVSVEFGLPPNYFAVQSSPLSAVRPTTAKLVRPVATTGQTAASAVGAVRPLPQTGQTSTMVMGLASAPTLAPIPSLAAPG